MEYTVNIIWDDEARVWMATGDDVPGLILESDSYDRLVERVKAAVPELLKLSGRKEPAYKVVFLSRRQEMISANG